MTIHHLELRTSSSKVAPALHRPATKILTQHPILLAGGAILLVLLFLGGAAFWLYEGRFESTDDAYVDAHIVRLAPQVSGRVTKVLVDDYQPVARGELLVVIDSAEGETRVAQSRAAVAQAEAQLENATAQIIVSRATYEQAEADIAAASAQAENAARDLARFHTLQTLNPAAVARQQLDQAEALARQTAAQRNALVKAAAARRGQITASMTQVAAGEDQVRAAKAQLSDASINLGYARLVAPVAGYVAQSSVALGNYVQPGAQLLAIVPLELWITANFKETQLAFMRAGQSVSVHVDACPRDHIEGRVDSIQRGAGQAFSILPAENATGNFVKVVQRVPVKIVLDHPPRDCLLGPGMSVEPTVRVR